MDIEAIIRAIGVLGITGIVFAESGLLVGFFLPGDTLLFAAGFLTQQGALGVNIHLLVLLLTIAAIAGYGLGYVFGHKFGRKLFAKPNTPIFNHDNLIRAEKFYEKYGALTIIIGRFVPFARTFVPIVAGIARMNYTQFTLYNAIGAVIWIASIVYLGYFGGAWLEERGINVEMLVMPVILAVVVFSIASPLWHIVRDPGMRAAWLKKLKLKK